MLIAIIIFKCGSPRLSPFPHIIGLFHRRRALNIAKLSSGAVSAPQGFKPQAAEPGAGAGAPERL
ncbi:MAG: hypothetical protein LBU32_05020 [Clostridiales bacterium]|nr:hypothetical protein [Clostridiales bacterium]